MVSQDRVKFGQYPSAQFPKRLFDEATQGIANYMVSFAVSGRQSGSATLATFEGAAGFLTAAHVADNLIDADGETVEIIYTNVFHRLSVRKQFLTTTRLRPTPETIPSPDLAFIRINDLPSIGTLKAKKSFIPVTADMAPIFDAVPDKPTAVCCLAGMPAEMTKQEGIPRTRGHRFQATLFFGRTQVMEELCADSVYYNRCEMFAGSNGFPADYRGVSGGSVWHIPFFLDPDKGDGSIGYCNPELIGVAFYQFEPAGNSGVILTHSHKSIYSLLMMAQNAG
jgi:hypothetical protein